MACSRSLASALVLIAGLALAGCGAGDQPAPAATHVGAHIKVSATPAPTPWTFTVSGNHPVVANQSQDTYAATPGAVCDGAEFTADMSIGKSVAGGFRFAGFPAAAALLDHFLSGTGTEVDYQAGSSISRQALASGAFRAVDQEVQAVVLRRLRAGATRIRLSAAQLPTVAFESTNSDLYWGFRGTQGLTVTGGGTRTDGRYLGTLTYVIRDSYGFPPNDVLDGFGPPMRYLQTVCGAPQHPGGARWFPDTITVTVPFDQA
jgi:hypothetical protein